MIPNAPVFTPGTTMFGSRIADGNSPSATDGQIFVGQSYGWRDQVLNTMDYTELQAVRVTKSGGLLPNRPWSINEEFEATDYADGAGDFDVALPDPDLPDADTVAENDIAYVVREGRAKSRPLTGGDATGFAPGTLVEHETSGASGSDVGVKSATTLSKATIGMAINTLAASTNGTVYVQVRKRY